MSIKVGIMKEIAFKPVITEDIDKAREIEVSFFPPEEAVPKHVFIRSNAHTKELFSGWYCNGELIGFICGSRYDVNSYDPDCMQRCVDNGHVLCLHSICFTASERRKGQGSNLMSAYIQMVRNSFPDIDRIILVSKEYLLPFYTNLGYKIKGPANITFGKDPWFECWYELKEN